MVQCIQNRKSSFLGNEEWQSVPWELTPKDVCQKLYDKGFTLAALLEKIDKTLLDSNASISSLLAFLDRLSRLNTEMDVWYRELLSECPSPLYWIDCSRLNQASTFEGGQSREGLELGSLPPFAFPTLRIANITVTYWALRIVLSNTIAITCGAVLSVDTPLLQARTLHSGDVKSMAQQQLSHHGDRIRLEYANDITRSMSYCLDESMGLLGAQKSLFALRMALFSLRRHPGMGLDWCKAIYQQMHDKKGLRYAREIAKFDGRHSTSGRDSMPMKISPRLVDAGQAGYSSAQVSFRPNPSSSIRETQPPDLDEAFLTNAYRQDVDIRVSMPRPLQGMSSFEDPRA